MNIPTHVVIDTEDGWTWWRDAHGLPFVEDTATAWAAVMNEERKFVDKTNGTERSGFIVAAVTPVMSPQLMAAAVKPQQTMPMIEQGLDGLVHCTACQRVIGMPTAPCRECADYA